MDYETNYLTSCGLKLPMVKELATTIKQSQLSRDTVDHTQHLLPACSYEEHSPVLQVTAILFGTSLATGVQLDLPDLLSHPSPPPLGPPRGLVYLSLLLLFGQFSIQLVCLPLSLPRHLPPPPHFPLLFVLFPCCFSFSSV